MNISYSFSEGAKSVSLTVSGLSVPQKEEQWQTASHSLRVIPSGINRLESNFGETTIWVSPKGWKSSTVTLNGYAKEDVDIYKARIIEVIAKAALPVEITAQEEFDAAIETLKETFLTAGKVTEEDFKTIVLK